MQKIILINYDKKTYVIKMSLTKSKVTNSGAEEAKQGYKF